MFNLITMTILKTQQFFAAGAACDPNEGASSFFGFPHWYQYLEGQTDELTSKCIPTISKLTDFWGIALAVVDILLRIGGMLAVVYIIYGGFRYMTSQGEPERINEAKNTLLNAVIGLVIVIIAIVAVNFVGSQLS